jgi:ABC-type lipoprotein release transport system permease subunit
MALGAHGGQVQRLVLREGTALIAVGSVVGIGAAVAVARAASSVTAQLASVFGRTDDPLLVAGAPLLLATLALAACYVPARRATRIEPVTALREE